MSVREYVGARYLPLFMGEWDNTVSYEPLSVVQYQGNSYTSRQHVPIGIEIDNEIYWGESGNYNAQVEQYRQEVLTFDNRITANTDNINLLINRFPIPTNDIQNNAVSLDKLNQDVMDFIKYESHNVSADTAYYTYVNNSIGDDETGVASSPESSTHPFKTLEAAFKEAQALSSDLRFRITNGGTYYLPARILAGCVLHIESTVDNVEVITKNDHGNIFFYDAHFNIRCEDGNGKITFTVKDTSNTLKVLEAEGSTIWANRVIFNCEKLYLIQGSANLANTIVNGFNDIWFAYLRYHNVTLNNTANSCALSLMSCNLRVENQPFIIGANPTYGGNNRAIECKNSVIRFNNNFTCVNKSYNKVLFSTASTLYATDTYYNNWKSQGAVEEFDLDTTLRVPGNIKANEITVMTADDTQVPAGGYVDVTFTFDHQYITAPIAIGYLLSTSESSQIGSFYACAHTITRTGCKVRVFNNSENQRTPSVQCLIIGQ